MAPIIGIIIVVAIIVAIEAPALWKKRWIKELWVFSVLMLVGTSLSLAQALRAPIPNPLDWITAVYKPISDFLLGGL